MGDKAGGLTCGFSCVINENANKIPFKSGPFCDNLNKGFVFDQYFFRSNVERDALVKFCGKTCSAISSEICGNNNNNGSNITNVFDQGDEDSFEWSPKLFKSVFRDCCDDYGETFKCRYCNPGTILENPGKLAINNRTTFQATCFDFETWFDLEYWSHRMGETLDNYGPPSGSPAIACNELKWRDPIWSPIREWDSIEEDCACIEPAPSSFPTESKSPTSVPSYWPTTTAIPTNSKEPSLTPSIPPSDDPNSSKLAGSRSDSDDQEECSPKPSETFSSLGGLFVGIYVAATYAFLFRYKRRWGLYEMTSEVVGQFVATVIGVGGIFICSDDENSNSIELIMSMTSLLSVDGFELILTLITIPFIDPNGHPGDNFDKSRWNQLDGWSMWLTRFLIWAIGSGLPLVILFFTLFEEDLPLYIIIPCCMSLGLGILFGFFGPCVLRNPNYTGGGTRAIWVLVKWFVGVIPGLIIAFYKKDWVALGWGAEVFIDCSHFILEYI
mmetsp:Transcript_1100/g.1371  ORF Transcript_1100/g.1371 Transcript_1100/m.1371 type:complete len:498 (-) Transcript_1100:111-1604(-)